MSQQRDRLHTQELYLPLDESIMVEQVQCQEKLYDYNQTRPLEFEKRTAMLISVLNLFDILEFDYFLYFLTRVQIARIILTTTQKKAINLISTTFVGMSPK